MNDVKEIFWRAVLIAAIVCFGACRPRLCPEAKLVEPSYEGDCLGEIVYRESSADIIISPQPWCPWERLVELSIFEGFKPGMTIKEARRQVGPPDTELETASRRLWRYQRPQGIVQIGHEDQGSEIIPFYYWWTLRAFPRDPSLEAFFSSEVMARMPKEGKFDEIFVSNQCGLSMVVISIEKGKIESISWTKNPGSYSTAGK